MFRESNQEGVAHNSVDLDETQEGENLCHENDPGAGEASMGYGSASLAECIDRMGTQPNTTSLATCASGEGNIGSSPYTNPRQVMSPKPSQTLPQDPFHGKNHLGWKLTSDLMSPPSSVRRRRHQPHGPRGKNFDVKEEPESPGLRE